MVDRKHFTAFFFTVLLLSLTFAIAAGSSTVSSSDSRKVRIQDKMAVADAAQAGECDTLDTRKDRITCRLKYARDNGRVARDAVNFNKQTPEACRNLDDKTKCVGLYTKVYQNKCYDLESNKKAACFRRTLNVAKTKIKDIEDKDERRAKAKEYITLLLYDIQQRIENRNEEGKISDEDASQIIDLIVTIKQQILDGEGRDAVKANMMELRELIKNLRSENSDSSDATDTTETTEEETTDEATTDTEVAA